MPLTDWELLRTSPAPVLLVRGTQPYERPIVLAAVDPTHAHAKPAKLDDAILAHGGRLARALSGSLHAMHAYYPVPLDVPTSAIRTDASVAKLYKQVRARARVAFEKAVRHARVPRARSHLIDYNPVDAIPATARKIGADIVVMGAVSRSGLKRVFILLSPAPAADHAPEQAIAVGLNIHASARVRATTSEKSWDPVRRRRALE